MCWHRIISTHPPVLCHLLTLEIEFLNLGGKSSGESCGKNWGISNPVGSHALPSLPSGFIAELCGCLELRREGYSFPLEVQEPKLWTAASEDLREVVLQGQN